MNTKDEVNKAAGSIVLGLIRLPFAVAADVVTMGGAVNDGIYKNGGRTYTDKVLNDTAKGVGIK